MSRFVRLAGGLGAGIGLLPPLLRLGDAVTLGGGAARRRTSRPFQVLLYHRVNDSADPLFDTVSVRAFDRQTALLARHFSVLSLDELLERRERDDVPPNAIAITFDDGYRDNFEFAFPILRRRGLPATVFLTSGTVGSNELLWHDRLLDAFLATRVAALEVGGKELPMRRPRERRAALYACLRTLRALDPDRRDRVVARLTSALEVAEPDERRWSKLGWDEVSEMAAGGISFGAHTVSHPILTRIPRDEAVREIRDSRDAIERALGRPVTLFAYPNGSRGDFDEHVKRAVRDAGFRCAVTTVAGANDGGTDPFELRRVGMWDPAPRTAVMRLAWSKLTS